MDTKSAVAEPHRRRASDPIHTLIRAGQPIDRASLSDRDTPLDSLVGEPATQN
jgi:hypothetical protein